MAPHFRSFLPPPRCPLPGPPPRGTSSALPLSSSPPSCSPVSPRGLRRSRGPAKPCPLQADPPRPLPHRHPKDAGRTGAALRAGRGGRPQCPRPQGCAHHAVTMCGSSLRGQGPPGAETCLVSLDVSPTPEGTPTGPRGTGLPGLFSEGVLGKKHDGINRTSTGVLPSPGRRPIGGPGRELEPRDPGPVT